MIGKIIIPTNHQDDCSCQFLYNRKMPAQGHGVDHGLGGKDNLKSKQKREKKAQKQKAKALYALKGGHNKKEIVFDEDARRDWLSGFGKRKQERRKYGLAMEVSLVSRYSQQPI